MAARKEVEKAVHIREFQRTVEQLLTPEDKDYLFYAMKEYNTYKSVAKLMLALNSCLDTPEKLDLLPYVRDLIPKHDRKRFDNLAPYNRMAHPFRIKRSSSTDSSRNKTVNGSIGAQGVGTEESSRIITLHRSSGMSLGFSIRGGREHDLGIFISHVDPFSLAEQSGLQVGDQIVAVNGISFDRLSHHSAVLVLKSHDNLKIEVKNIGCVPGQQLGRNSFIWVDPIGNPIDGPQESPEPLVTSTDEREGESTNRLFNSVDRHKVVLHTDKKRPLGFSVRGGKEYGLGIYVSIEQLNGDNQILSTTFAFYYKVDKESPSEEAGLQVGDQIMDINGHSFSSIFHQEAVYILRSYPTLIMTIKSLGKLPALAPTANNEEGVSENESTKASPRDRSSSFIKSFTLPRRRSTFTGSLSRLDESTSSTTSTDTNDGDTQSSEKDEGKVRVAKVKRSHSDRSHSVGSDSVDYGGNTSLDNNRQRSNSSDSPASIHRRKPMVVSPLATHESRASPSPFTSPTSVTPKFFERGVGTQVMLASVSSQAKQLLLDHARRIMNDENVTSFNESLEKYEGDDDIQAFVDVLIPMLDTPEKIKLLTDVRSVLNPAHVVMFDEMVSPLEVEALHPSDSNSGTSEGNSQHYKVVLSPIEKKRWSKLGLALAGEEKKSSLPDLGAFGSIPQPVLQKNSTVTTSEPNLSGLQSRESFLPRYKKDAALEQKESGKRGNDQADGLQSQQNSKRTPVTVEVRKDSAFLGLAIKGGVDTPLKNVYVRELRKGGAIYNNGFIQPGFEVVQVDDKVIRGKTYTEAVETIAEAYNSDNKTIKLSVIPRQK